MTQHTNTQFHYTTDEQVASIPQELRMLSHWVVWKAEIVDGRRTKVPYQISGSKAKSDNPHTWTTFDRARAALRNKMNHGIGFQFGGSGYTGIDLDHCIDPETGAIDDWARLIVDSMASYTEHSPNGEGLHIFIKGTIEGGRGTRKKQPGKRHPEAAIEMYSSGRFFTMTGKPFAGTPATIAENHDAIQALYQRLTAKAPLREQPRAETMPNTDDDDAIIARIRASRQGAKFDQLMAGSTSAYGDDESAADMALFALLAFWTKDPAHIRRLAFRSRLANREKWGREDYITRSIDRALELVRDKAKAPRNIHDHQAHHETRAETEQVDPSANNFDALRAMVDERNTERFIEKFGRDLCWVPKWKKWMHWDGKRWRVTSEEFVIGLAKKTVCAMYSELSMMEDEVQRIAFRKHVMRSDRLKMFIDMERSARADLCIEPDQFDRDPWLLNVMNGTIDLRALALHPHRREDFITKIAPTAFDPNAECPRWDGFLAKFFANNTELIGFLQRAAGYALTGDAGEKAVFICHGVGDNGKSTFINTLMALLGDYADQMATETIMTRRFSKDIANDIARLKGLRFVAASEGEEGQRLAEAKIKTMTGNDTLVGEFKYGEQFSFPASHKIWIGTNHKPIIAGTDQAIWNRIKLIPFDVTIAKDEIDRTFAEKLRMELPGILRWALAGCRDWQQHGLGVPKAVTEATLAYRSEMDTFAHFLEACCTVQSAARARSKSLIEAYKTWCDENNERAVSSKTFAQKLRERGIRDEHSDKGTIWYGLGLLYKDDVPQTDSTDSTDSKNEKYSREEKSSKKFSDPAVSAVSAVRIDADSLIADVETRLVDTSHSQSERVQSVEDHRAGASPASPPPVEMAASTAHQAPEDRPHTAPRHDVIEVERLRIALLSWATQAERLNCFFPSTAITMPDTLERWGYTLKELPVSTLQSLKADIDANRISYRAA